MCYRPGVDAARVGIGNRRPYPRTGLHQSWKGSARSHSFGLAQNLPILVLTFVKDEVKQA